MSKVTRFILFGAFLITTNCAYMAPSSAITPESYRPCLKDSSRQLARSVELQKIVSDDQSDRKDFQNKTSAELMEMAKRDVERRQRVGQIFGEGCFKSAADYAAAALVFQHGDSPDHYWQTFTWSKRGVDLGDESQKNLMALGLDRYLVDTGQKQLFASQANAVNASDPKSCFCLQQIEHSFPDTLRKKHTGRALKDSLEWLKTLNTGKNCPNSECSETLKPSPKGSVPGFW